MGKFKVVENVPIFKYGENANGWTIPVSEVADPHQFKDVVILDRISNDFAGESLSRPVGVILEATRLEFPFVYGRVAIEKGFKVEGFRNYEVEVGSMDEKQRVWFDVTVLAIELALVEDKKRVFIEK